MTTAALLNIPASQTETLRTCCLITDGNSHRRDLLETTNHVAHIDLISEAMLPQIRTVAMLIAAERHDFSQRSPAVFSEEADWFAARIIVLQARIFHLDISLNGMLQTANSRARAFAEKHKLPFTPAKMLAGLYTKRPAAMLLCECAINSETVSDLVQNSRNISQSLHKMM